MFGNIGGAAAADLALEAFEDDVEFTSRTVSLPPSLPETKLTISSSTSSLP